MDSRTICSVEGCGKDGVKKGMCEKHYGQALRATKTEPCSVAGCSTRNYRKGLCTAHYRASRSDIPPCSVEGCDKLSISRGLCPSHYYRFKKFGDPLAGQARPNAGFDLVKQVAENPPEGCVYWPYGKLESGYGSLFWEGKRITAHRLALIFYEGLTENPPRERVARHLCGNGHLGCFNPRCCAWGTVQQNVDDAVEMGRVPHGDNHTYAKLTAAQIPAIREAEGTYDAIASRYGVTRNAIRQVKLGLTWKHVK